MSQLDKHVHYGDQHVPDEEFWGIGVENETYIEIVGGLEIPARFLLENKVRERYSVNYWLQYKPGAFDRALGSWIAHLKNGAETRIRLPLLMNGHTISKCDPTGQHRTVLDISGVAVPNPAFSGKTLLEHLALLEPAVFGYTPRAAWWCFDGDTVEFMTQRFRRAKYEDVIAELCGYKRTWIAALRGAMARIPDLEPVLRYAKIRWPTANYGLAAFLTNRSNVAIFNNGTYHINITAPTRLDKNGEIADWSRFETVHRRAARLFQWISPFLVAVYGSADPLANLADPRYAGGFPAGSQRAAASRYIGIGTYDTRAMPRGKILTNPRTSMDPAPTWWVEMHERYGSQYNLLEMMGYDINFNKYKNHGLEFRIFDWFPERRLDDLLRLLIAMFDCAVQAAVDPPIPQDSAAWRGVLGRCVWHGTSAHLTAEEAAEFAAVLDCPRLRAGPIQAALATLQADWTRRGGPCTDRMCKDAPRHPVVQRPLLPQSPLKPCIPNIHRMEDLWPPIRLRETAIIRVSLFRELRWRRRQRPPTSPDNMETRLRHIRSLIHGADHGVDHGADPAAPHEALSARPSPDAPSSFYIRSSGWAERTGDSQALLAVPEVDQRCLPRVFSRSRPK